ncbi:MAG: helix-turn-helix domain-containing protein [Sedimentisphaerales bacterium]|nr:helix-turn-helix domain-containing protein [Sedimentisphaerales bacterium]
MNQVKGHGDRLLSTSAVARILSLSKRTVHRLNASALIVRPLRISGSVRYLESELMAWIRAGMPSRQEWEAFEENRHAN